MILSPVIRQKFFNTSGAPLAGGKLYTYVAGTTTPQATYVDQGGATPNTNPVVLDANGEANVWLDPSLAYKFVLQDSSGVTQWTIDQVAGAGLTGVPQWSANANYSVGNIVADASGTGILYVSLTSNNLGNALTSVSNWRTLFGNIRTLVANTTLTVTDEVVRSNSTSGVLTHTLPPCSTTPIGKRIVVKDIGTGGYNTSVKGSGTDLVDGNNTYPQNITKYDSAAFINNGSSWDSVFSPANPLAPTIQKFTSGTGTYTLPTLPRKPLYIRVRMVGGGGGGASSAAGTAPPAATAGANSTFGNLTAGLGAAGVWAGGGGAGGAGGGYTIGSGWIGLGMVGGAGGGSGYENSGSVALPGGFGGSTPFAGAGTSSGNSAGGSAQANSGSGGAGGGAGNGQTNFSTGPGGGAGGYIDAITVGAPASTYSYAVGAQGAGSPNTGSSFTAGGAGAAGVIIVEEYYQ